MFSMYSGIEHHYSVWLPRPWLYALWQNIWSRWVDSTYVILHPFSVFISSSPSISPSPIPSSFSSLHPPTPSFLSPPSSLHFLIPFFLPPPHLFHPFILPPHAFCLPPHPFTFSYPSSYPSSTYLLSTSFIPSSSHPILSVSPLTPLTYGSLPYFCLSLCY